MTLASINFIAKSVSLNCPSNGYYGWHTCIFLAWSRLFVLKETPKQAVEVSGCYLWSLEGMIYCRASNSVRYETCTSI